MNEMSCKIEKERRERSTYEYNMQVARNEQMVDDFKNGVGKVAGAIFWSGVEAVESLKH